MNRAPTIVCHVDDSDHSRRALQYAAFLMGHFLPGLFWGPAMRRMRFAFLLLILVVAVGTNGLTAPHGVLDTTFDTDGRQTVDVGLVTDANGGGAPANVNVAAAPLCTNLPLLDPSFDADGRQTTNFAGNDRGHAVVIQPDGKIVVAGQGPGGYLAIARFKVDGTLDATFGVDGRVSHVGVPSANAVALQADGKIVVAGSVVASVSNWPPTVNYDFSIARLNPDGTLDATFDGDGKATIDFLGPYDFANSVAIQADGKIVVAGFASSDVIFGYIFGDFAIARLLPNGERDLSFSGGLVRVEIGLGSSDAASSVVVQPDGYIVVGGRTGPRSNLQIGNFAMARLTPGGKLDTAFGGAGRVTTDFGAEDHIYSLALQADGKIVAAGSSDGGQSDFAVARYHSDGSLDPSFAGDGRQTLTFGAPPSGGEDVAVGVVLQANGKVVLAGYSDAGAGNDFAMARLTTDGSPDTTFNATGRFLVNFGNDDRASGAASRDGAIVVAGWTTLNSQDSDFAVLRLLGNPPTPLPTLTVNDVSVLETTGAPAATSFTLTLSAASVFPISVDVATAAISATDPADYGAVATGLLFPPGVTTRTVTVSIVGDALDEPAETLALNLSNACNATIADAQGLGTIYDNDLAVTITVPTSDPATAVNASFITVAGTASDAVGIANVTWVSDRGGSGTAAGTTSWTIASVPTLSGINVITVTARDVAGNTTTDTLTVTLSSLVYYLAEGATGPFFDYDLLLANPNAVVAPVRIDFLRDDGVIVPLARDLPATSRTTIRVDDVAGLAFTAVSAVVTSTNALPIVVERSMYWDSTYYGGHTGSSVARPGTNWLFAEGSQGFFDTYVLLANANAAPANVTVRFLLEEGTTVVKTYTVDATSRFNVYAGIIPGLVGQSFSIVVESSLPIIAERAMYFGSPLFNGGHESAGVAAASTTWFHAEGATGPYFDTFILVGNPNASAATVTMTFLRDTGATVVKTKVIPGNTRLTVNVEGEDPQLANTAVSTTVTSDLPVISERAMYWPGGFTSWFEAHNSFGVTETATKWGLAEGRVGGPFAFQTYILLANPSTTTAAEVRITYLKTDGTTVVKNYTVNATTRYNVSVHDIVPELAGQQFGALIEVTNGVPIAVERAVYNNAGGVIWAAGTNATAVRVP